MRSNPLMRVMSSARRMALLAGPLAASSASVKVSPCSLVAVVASSISRLRAFCCVRRFRLSSLTYFWRARLT